MRKSVALGAMLLGWAAVPAHADTVCEWMDFGGKIEAAGVEAQKLVVRTGQYRFELRMQRQNASPGRC